MSFWLFQYSLQRLVLNQPASEGELFLSLTLICLVLSKFHKSQQIMTNRVCVIVSPVGKKFLKIEWKPSSIKAFTTCLREKILRFDDVLCYRQGHEIAISASVLLGLAMFCVKKWLWNVCSTSAILVDCCNPSLHPEIFESFKYVQLESWQSDSLIGLFPATPQQISSAYLCISYNCIGLAAMQKPSFSASSLARNANLWTLSQAALPSWRA